MQMAYIRLSPLKPTSSDLELWARFSWEMVILDKCATLPQSYNKPLQPFSIGDRYNNEASNAEQVKTL